MEEQGKTPTPEEALDFITSVIRSQSLTYEEHAYFEACRNRLLTFVKN